MPTDVASKRAAFRQMHDSGFFVLPNPWDAGSARYLQAIGFDALATTSSGYAWSRGQADGALNREMTLAHMREIVASAEVPVNADFEGGFGQDASGVAESVRMAIDTGVAGLSIEDSTGDPSRPLRSIEDGVARIRAARAAIDGTGGDTLLVGRAENFFVGVPDLNDAIARLKAYAEAGADCLYAPGIETREQIEAIVRAVAPKPVNVLIGSPSRFNVQDLAAMGVRRVSLGGALARAAWGGFLRAARSLAELGVFDGFADATPHAQLNSFFTMTNETGARPRSAEVIGGVTFREGEGPSVAIRPGPIEVITSALDATLSWGAGSAKESAAMPIGMFCEYVAQGKIKMVM
jgi:2-methylisocitrate lyase-like PEP mutase family enzyme